MEYDGIINWLGIDYWPAKTSSIPFSSISCSIFTGKSWKSPCHSCPKPRVGIKVFCFAWPHVSGHVIDLEPVPSICRPPTLVPQEIWQNNSTEWIVLGIPALFQMIGLTALANELVSIPQIYTTTLWRTPKKVRPCWAPLSLACPHAVVTTMHFSSVFHIFPLKPVPMSSNVSLSLYQCQCMVAHSSDPYWDETGMALEDQFPTKHAVTIFHKSWNFPYVPEISVMA